MGRDSRSRSRRGTQYHHQSGRRSPSHGRSDSGAVHPVHMIDEYQGCGWETNPIWKPFWQTGDSPVKFWPKLPLKIRFVCWLQFSTLRNHWLALTKDSVGPVNSDGQLCAFHEFRKFWRSVRSYCRRLLLMDVSGLHASSNFRTIYLGISNYFWCGFWVNGRLLHCFWLLTIRPNVGSLAFFISCTCLRIWTFEWWSQTNVVHMRLHWTGDFWFEAQKLRFSYVSNLVHVNTDLCWNVGESERIALAIHRFNHLRIFLLHMLGSDTLMKFECSELLHIMTTYF